MSSGEFHIVGCDSIPVFFGGEQVMLTPQNTKIRMFGEDHRQYNHCEVTLNGEGTMLFRPEDEMMEAMESGGFDVNRECEAPDEQTVEYFDRLMECETDRVEEGFNGLL